MATEDAKPEPTPRKNPRFYNGESVYYYAADLPKRARAKIKKTKMDRAKNFYYDIVLDETGEKLDAIPGSKLKRIKQKAPADAAKETSSSSKPKPSTRPNKIALDNDECLGGFRVLSVLYQIHRYHRQYNKNGRFGDSTRETFMELVCEYYLARRGVRPNLARLFRTIMQLKLTGKVEEVYMYTSAENVDGWVVFLKDAMEHFAGVPGMYDEVFSKKSLQQIRASCGATKKDLLNVATNSKKITMNKTDEDAKTSNILMFDDKPHNVNHRSGTVIGVRAYYDWPNWEDIMGLVRAHPGMTEFAKWAWQGWEKFERELFKHFDPKGDRVDLSQDTQVETMIRQIKVLYDVDEEELAEPGAPTRRHTERLNKPPVTMDFAAQLGVPGQPKGQDIPQKLNRAMSAPEAFLIPAQSPEELAQESRFETRAKVNRQNSVFQKSKKHLDADVGSPSDGKMVPPTTPDVRKGKKGFGFDDATITKAGSGKSPHADAFGI